MMCFGVRKYAKPSGSSISFIQSFWGRSNLIFMDVNLKSFSIVWGVYELFFSIASCLSPSFSRVDGLRQNGQFPPFPTGRTSLFLPRLAGFLFSSLQNNAGWMKSAANQSFMVFLRAIWHPCTLLFFEISTRGKIWTRMGSGEWRTSKERCEESAEENIGEW